MALKPSTGTLTVGGLAALLVAAFALLSGGDITSIRTTLGAGTSSYTDPTTTIGDLVTRGDAGVTRIAIGADASVLTSVAGRAVWAVPASETYPVQMLSGGLESDWSGLGSSPAAATATIASSTVTIDTPASTSCDVLSGACSTDAVRAARTIPYYDPSAWSLRARLVSVSAYGLYITNFGVATGSSWSTSVAKYVVYIVGDADNVVLARYGASGSTHGSASVTGIRAGQGWVRFDALGRTLTVYAAVGVAGAEPTSWGSPIGTVTMTVTDPQPQRVVIFSTGSTGGSARSAVWDSVRLQAVE